MNKPKARTRPLLKTATLLLSTLALTLTLTGCQTTKTVLVPSDRAVVALPQGKPFTPPVPGWFVPNARMYDMLNALDAARIKGQ